MVLHLCNNNGGTSTNPNDGDSVPSNDSPLFSDDIDSSCSTPYVSAPSSPGRAPINGGFFYSCPASPMHFAITATYSASAVSSPDRTVPMGYEFEFSARLGLAGAGQTGGAMSSADELFLNGQIRPMKLSTHLERPQVLAPLIDLDEEEEEEDDFDGGAKNGGRMRGRDLRLRDKSMRRRTRSMSPLRSSPFEFSGEEEGEEESEKKTKSQICSENEKIKITGEEEEEEEVVTVPSSASASSSRSSSAGRNSKRWVFLKDFLYRSKSEGRSNNKFWSNISFSPAKEKKSLQKEKLTPSSSSSSSAAATTSTPENNSSSSQKSRPNQQNPSKKPVNGVGKRRIPASLSPHELHYKASKAQAEEMRKKTFLPYRQGLLGCLGFSSKGYGAMNGFARALNPVSSR